MAISIPGIFRTLYELEGFKPENISWKETMSEEDTELDAFLDNKWEEQLKKKKAALEKNGNPVLIQPDEQGIPALYEVGKKIMYDDPVLVVGEIAVDEKGVLIQAHQERFSTVGLWDDEEYLTYLEKQGKVKGELIGTNALLVTSDDYLVLIQRSEKTTTHPGLICVPGGRPSSCGESPLVHQLHENAEEIGLKDTDYNSMGVRAIVRNDQVEYTLLLFGMVLNLTRAEVEKQYASLQDQPIDVSSLEYFSPQRDLLLQRLLRDFSRQGERGCLTTGAYAQLTLYGKERYGDEWFRELERSIAMLNKTQ
ncbi:MAG: hypothetical protein WC595_06265 [Candidatus Nanoarchaeia archaeon]